MYTNQSCDVTWPNNRSETFTISNGVKQGGVISPLLFSLYIDNLFLEHTTLGYADDIALIAPSICRKKKTIITCEMS